MCKRLPFRYLLPLLVLATASVVHGVQAVRGPYLQLGTTNSMTIRWRTNAATNSIVQYGPATNAFWYTNVNSVSTTEHIATLTNLTASTRYYYAIRSSSEHFAGNDSNHYFQTSPIIGADGSYRLWVVGDSGFNHQPSRDVRDAYYALSNNKHTDAFLLLGDNAYNDGTDAEYTSYYFDLFGDLLRNTVAWPSPGDHDLEFVDSIAQTGPYYDIFTLPKNGEAGGVASGTEAYYSFDYGNMHFITLNTFDIDRSADAHMMTWFTNDLATTTQKWVIAYWHHAPYSKGSHDSDDITDDGGVFYDLRTNALPYFEKHGGALLMTGNSHAWERSYLLHGHYGTSSTLNASSMILDNGDGRVDGDGAYVAGARSDTGTVYVVCGGSSIVRCGTNGMAHPAHYTNVCDKAGSILLEVVSNRLDVSFIDKDGVVRDYFTILHALRDDDGDGLRDKWELEWFGDLAQTASGDFDRDGLTNGLEQELASNPLTRITPTWWSTRSVLDTNSTTNDYALLNVGQLKWIATNAFDEMEATYTGGAGSNITVLVTSFSSSNNYAGVNLGQLKSIATPFYNRLMALGKADQCPWTGAATTNDYAGVNIGQTKHVFSFAIEN